MDQQALGLNDIIVQHSHTVFSLLSERGKKIFFPKKGILAQSAEAKGKKINATIGEAVEDDGSPMRLKSLENLIKINPGSAFPYAPSTGKQDIRTKWKEMLYQKNPSLAGKPVSLPLVTNALTHGLSITGYLFVNTGDIIYIPDLYWENYNLIFENAYNAEIRSFRLFKDDGLDFESFRNILSDKTSDKKIILLNFPNNPAGYTPLENEAHKIVSLIKESAEKGNRILVIIDDAYFGLVYEDGVIKESLFSWLSDVHENVLAVKLDGPTKEDYVWGFRVGFITFGIKNGNAELYSALEFKTAGAIRGNISNVSNLSQSLLNAAYESTKYEKEKKEKYEKLKSRYMELKIVLTDHKEYIEMFQPIPYNSGYFMCIKLSHGIDGEKVRKLLLEEFETGVISMSGVIRIAYSCVSKNKIAQLFEFIYRACIKVKEGQ